MRTGMDTLLLGGSVPVFDEVVLSLSLMNKVISLDKAAGLWLQPSACSVCHSL